MLLLNWNILTGACQGLSIGYVPMKQIGFNKTIFDGNMFFLSAVGVKNNCDYFTSTILFQPKMEKSRPGRTIRLVECLHLCCAGFLLEWSWWLGSHFALLLCSIGSSWECSSYCSCLWGRAWAQPNPREAVRTRTVLPPFSLTCELIPEPCSVPQTIQGWG